MISDTKALGVAGSKPRGPATEKGGRSLGRPPFCFVDRFELSLSVESLDRWAVLGLRSRNP